MSGGCSKLNRNWIQLKRTFLSTLTAADVDAEMVDAFMLMYYGWVEKEDKEDDVDVLMKESSDRARDKVRYIQKETLVICSNLVFLLTGRGSC